MRNALIELDRPE